LSNNKLINGKLICAFRWSVLSSTCLSFSVLSHYYIVPHRSGVIIIIIIIIIVLYCFFLRELFLFCGLTACTMHAVKPQNKNRGGVWGWQVGRPPPGPTLSIKKKPLSTNRKKFYA